MKSCSEIRQSISQYLDGEMGKDLRISFEQHVNRCDACKKELDEMGRLVSLLRDMEEVELPADFKARLHDSLAAVHEEEAGMRRRTIKLGRIMKIGSSIAAVLVLAVCIRVFLWNTSLLHSSFSTAGSPRNTAAAQNAPAETAAVAPQLSDQKKAADIAGNATNEYTSRSDSLISAGAGSKGSPAPELRSSSSLQKSRETPDYGTSGGGGAAALVAPANPSGSKMDENITLSVDNPAGESDKIRNLSAKYGGIPADSEMKLMMSAAPAAGTFSAAAQTTGTESGAAGQTDTAAADGSPANGGENVSDILLNFKIPDDSAQQFIDAIKAEYGEAAVEVSTQDAADRAGMVNELQKQLDDIQNKLSAAEKDGSTVSQQDIDSLKLERDGIQSEIAELQGDIHYTFVSVRIRKK